MSKNNKNIRIGEQNRANNGQMMTIVAYKNASDIDIQFEDGLIVYHKDYWAFKDGRIKNPNKPTVLKQCMPTISRIGEKKQMNCGLYAKIINYENAKDIDIQFKDGTILSHRTYREFINGRLSPTKEIQCNLRATTRINNNKELHIGETNINNQNLEMKIIEYRNCTDIDVQFEDGVIVQHQYYQAFKKGYLSNPNVPIDNKQKQRIDRQKYNRLGKISENTQGIPMKIIEYRTEKDIDVQFENGVIVQHKRYSKFCEGKIKNPFPYVMNNISIDKRAYIYKNIRNFYCHCLICGHRDIMTIEEIKQHKCIKGDYHNGIK